MFIRSYQNPSSSWRSASRPSKSTAWEYETEQDETTFPRWSRGRAFGKESSFRGGRFESEECGLRGGQFESDDDRLFRGDKFEVKRRFAMGKRASSGDEVAAILQDISLDRERDCYQNNLVNTLLEDRRHNRNVYELLEMLSSGKKVSDEQIHQMLKEDMMLDQAVDDVILDIIEDNQVNRKTDHIIQDLEAGRKHVRTREDEKIEGEDQMIDKRFAKLVRRLMQPNAGEKLGKLYDKHMGKKFGAKRM